MATLSPALPKTIAARRRTLEAILHRARQTLLRRGEAIFCRATGFALIANLALTPGGFPSAARTIARAYAYRFWRPVSAGEWVDIVIAALVWPPAVIASALWLTCRNGAVVAAQSGRSRIRQCLDQIGLALTSGLLPPWYYVFELYQPEKGPNPRAYLTRGETKQGSNRLLAEAIGSGSPLVDKERFAHFCAKNRLRTLPVLFSIHDGEIRGEGGGASDDLFVKPVCGRGGKGAERWDHAGNDRYRNVAGQIFSAPELMEYLVRLSRREAFLVQPRAQNHAALRDLSNGALSTVRIITALDETQRPEVIGAVLKMAVGTNVTTDNVHAGAIAAAIDLEEGRLQQATYGGFDPRLGWIDRHPESGALITGRVLPMWDELRELVVKAHAAFNDWVTVGWDVAILEDGPVLVEGNNGPDLDLIQRPLRTAFGEERLGELIAFHLDRTEAIWRR
jgi:hypothetical protein